MYERTYIFAKEFVYAVYMCVSWKIDFCRLLRRYISRSGLVTEVEIRRSKLKHVQKEDRMTTTKEIK